MLDSKGTPLLQEVYAKLARERKVTALSPRLGTSLSNVHGTHSSSVSMASLLKSMVGPGGLVTASTRASVPRTNPSVDSLLHSCSLGLDASIFLPNYPINPFQLWNHLPWQASQLVPRQASLLELAEAVLKERSAASVVPTRPEPHEVLEAAVRLLAAHTNAANQADKEKIFLQRAAAEGLLGLAPFALRDALSAPSSKAHWTL
jgi:hypothetical protein